MPLNTPIQNVFSAHGYRLMEPLEQPLIQAWRGAVKIILDSGSAMLWVEVEDTTGSPVRGAVFSGIIDHAQTLDTVLVRTQAWLEHGDKGLLTDKPTTLNAPMDPHWSLNLLARPFRSVSPPPSVRLWYQGSRPSCVLEHDGVWIQCVFARDNLPDHSPEDQPFLVRLLAHPTLQVADLPLLASPRWVGGRYDSGNGFASGARKALQEAFRPVVSKQTFTHVFGRALIRAGYAGTAIAFAGEEDIEFLLEDQNILILSPLRPWARWFRRFCTPSFQGTWDGTGTLRIDVPYSAHARLAWLSGRFADHGEKILQKHPFTR